MVTANRAMSSASAGSAASTVSPLRRLTLPVLTSLAKDTSDRTGRYARGSITVSLQEVTQEGFQVLHRLRALAARLSSPHRAHIYATRIADT